MQIVVDVADAGTRVDQLLAHVPEIGSRSQAERLLREGNVELNGRVATKSSRVRGGDVLDVADAALAPGTPVQYELGEVPIAFQDEHLLVVDKPAQMAVHPAPGYKGASLTELLVSQGVELAPSDDAAFQRPGIVHRLDKDTSGLLVVAKTPHALRELQQLLRERKVHREYLALVQGLVSSRAGRIEAAIGRDIRDATRHSLDTDSPRDAITHFAVDELLPTTTLLRVWLETGRTHQIRVHFEAIGHPVVGDPVYGRDGPAFDATRQFLHASQLKFPHPVTADEISVSSPLPQDLQDVLGKARRSD